MIHLLGTVDAGGGAFFVLVFFAKRQHLKQRQTADVEADFLFDIKESVSPGADAGLLILIYLHVSLGMVLVLVHVLVVIIFIVVSMFGT